jgi:hypothetical protein
MDPQLGWNGGKPSSARGSPLVLETQTKGEEHPKASLEITQNK